MTEKETPWWEYLDWKEMKVVKGHYAIWSDEAKEFIRQDLGCDDCFGWDPDVCGENCPYSSKQSPSSSRNETNEGKK